MVYSVTIESELFVDNELNFDDYHQLAGVYELLGRLWLEELDLGLLQALATDEMKAAVENLGGNVPDTVDEETVEQLAVDYCQLLIGPKDQISPLQSVWEKQLLQSEAASSMQNFVGYLPGFQANGSLLDHIGVQLQFMGELFERAAAAKDHDLVEKFAEDFFQKHLKWTAPFLAAVAEKADTDFYAGLSNLTANFLNLEPSEY